MGAWGPSPKRAAGPALENTSGPKVFVLNGLVSG